MQQQTTVDKFQYSENNFAWSQSEDETTDIPPNYGKILQQQVNSNRFDMEDEDNILDHSSGNNATATSITGNSKSYWRTYDYTKSYLTNNNYLNNNNSLMQDSDGSCLEKGRKQV